MDMYSLENAAKYYHANGVSAPAMARRRELRYVPAKRAVGVVPGLSMRLPSAPPVALQCRRTSVGLYEPRNTGLFLAYAQPRHGGATLGNDVDLRGRATRGCCLVVEPLPDLG